MYRISSSNSTVDLQINMVCTRSMAIRKLSGELKRFRTQKSAAKRFNRCSGASLAVFTDCLSSTLHLPKLQTTNVTPPLATSAAASTISTLNLLPLKKRPWTRLEPYFLQMEQAGERAACIGTTTAICPSAYNSATRIEVLKQLDNYVKRVRPQVILN